MMKKITRIAALLATTAFMLAGFPACGDDDGDEEPTLEKIEIGIAESVKLEYDINEEFDKTGITVTATYSDGSTKDVTDKATFTATTSEGEFTTATAGKHNVTLTATYEGKTDTATREITVKNSDPADDDKGNSSDDSDNNDSDNNDSDNTGNEEGNESGNESGNENGNDNSDDNDSDTEEGNGNEENNGDEENNPGEEQKPNEGGSSESFLVPDEAKTGEIEAEAAVVDNTLFTVTSDGNLAYSIGKDATAGVPNPDKAISVTLLDGTTKTFKQGIKQSDATDPDGTTATKKVLVKAKEAITLRVYIALANDSFNSDRKGKIYYAIGSGEAKSIAVTKRTEVQSIEVNLAKDETLEVYAIIDTNSDTTKNAKLWLFGAEAKKQ